MENTRKFNPDLDTIAWGALFILWGITELFPALPDGTGALGIGAILLGLNLARSIERAADQRLNDHIRHPGPPVGRTGAGTPAAAPFL